MWLLFFWSAFHCWLMFCVTSVSAFSVEMDMCAGVCMSLKCTASKRMNSTCAKDCMSTSTESQLCAVSSNVSSCTPYCDKITEPDNIGNLVNLEDDSTFRLNVLSKGTVQLLVSSSSEAVIGADVLIFVKYAELLTNNTQHLRWSTLLLRYAKDFPVEWDRPSSCLSYAFRALAIQEGIISAWSRLIIVRPAPESAEFSWKARYLPDVQYTEENKQNASAEDLFGKGSVEIRLTVLPLPHRNERSRFRVENLEDITMRRFRAPRDGQFDLPIFQRRENTTDEFVLYLPAVDLEYRTLFSIMAPYLDLADTYCGRDNYRVEDDLTTIVQLNCASVLGSDSLDFCAGSRTAPQKPSCYSDIVNTSLDPQQDGTVDVDVSWNFTQILKRLPVVNKSVWKQELDGIKYFRVHYTPTVFEPRAMDPQSSELVRITHENITLVTTCGQVFQEAREVNCTNKTEHVRLIGLQPNQTYGVFVCAIYDEAEVVMTDGNRRAMGYAKRLYTHVDRKPIPEQTAHVWWWWLLLSAAASASLLAAFVYLRHRHMKRKEAQLISSASSEGGEHPDSNYYTHVAPKCVKVEVKLKKAGMTSGNAVGISWKSTKTNRWAPVHLVWSPKVRGVGKEQTDSAFAAIRQRFENCDVAVKRLPDFASESDTEKFLGEIALMKRLAQDLGFHEHIVNPLACITASVPYCLVVELCSRGSLLGYLRDRRDYMLKMDAIGINFDNDDQVNADMLLTERSLIQFAVNITYAMEHISTHGYVHRDLAARNILVHKAGSSCYAKVGDFGMARKLEDAAGDRTDCVHVAAGKVPVKWMAVESLQSAQYSVKTDVWSFGVLLFEIMSLGGSPYPTVEPPNLLAHLEAGNRMRRPDHCDANVYELMLDCWAAEAKDRPTFSDIRRRVCLQYDQVTETYNYITNIDAQADYYQCKNWMADEESGVDSLPMHEFQTAKTKSLTHRHDSGICDDHNVSPSTSLQPSENDVGL